VKTTPASRSGCVALHGIQEWGSEASITSIPYICRQVA
jgi:hypothetical protein